MGFPSPSASKGLGDCLPQSELVGTGEHELTVSLPGIDDCLDVTEQFRYSLDFIQDDITLESCQKAFWVIGCKLTGLGILEIGVAVDLGD